MGAFLLCVQRHSLQKEKKLPLKEGIDPIKAGKSLHMHGILILSRLNFTHLTAELSCCSTNDLTFFAKCWLYSIKMLARLYSSLDLYNTVIAAKGCSSFKQTFGLLLKLKMTAVI